MTAETAASSSATGHATASSVSSSRRIRRVPGAAGTTNATFPSLSPGTTNDGGTKTIPTQVLLRKLHQPRRPGRAVHRPRRQAQDLRPSRLHEERQEGGHVQRARAGEEGGHRRGLSLFQDDDLMHAIVNNGAGPASG